MEGVERYKVVLLEHNDDWDTEFVSVKAELENTVDGVIDIQHVGSTAIPLISAKPILDVAVLMQAITTREIKALESLGYSYCGVRDGNPNYHLFVLRSEAQISLRHIHCYDKPEKGFELLVGFRDYLNTHRDAAMQYENLKKSLLEQYQNDRAMYTKGKAAFIQEIYDKINGS